MATLAIEGDTVTITMTGMDKMMSLRGQLSIPLEHVTGVTARPEEARTWWRRFPMLAMNVPGIAQIGTFLTTEGFVFYDVRDPNSTIGLDLSHEMYKRVIVQVDDPDADAAKVQGALKP